MRLPIHRITAVALILLLTMLLAALWIRAGEPPGGVEPTGASGAYGKMTIDSGGGSVDSTAIRDHSFGITFPFTPGGGGSGHAAFTPFEVTKSINAKSPSLATSISIGEQLEQVTVQVYEPGSTRTAMTYRLEDVVILEMSVSPGASEIENIAFYYGEIRWKVGDQNFCFDLTLHESC